MAKHGKYDRSGGKTETVGRVARRLWAKRNLNLKIKEATVKGDSTISWISLLMQFFTKILKESTQDDW